MSETSIVPPFGAVSRQGMAATDEEYLAEAKRLVELTIAAGLNPEQHRILDIGCGAGRLMSGLIASGYRANEYVGLDVRRSVLDWCNRSLTRPEYGNARFVHIDVHNDRYHPQGAKFDKLTLPVADSAFEFVLLWSVFTHMTVADAKVYLSEIARVLTESGRCLLTAFIADGVPEWTENPKDYQHGKWKRPLHCCRFNREYFESLIAEADLRVVSYDPRHGHAVYVVHKA